MMYVESNRIKSARLKALKEIWSRKQAKYRLGSFSDKEISHSIRQISLLVDETSLAFGNFFYRVEF